MEVEKRLRRATGPWGLNWLSVKPQDDRIDGTFELGGIRVKLVTYKGKPGVVLVQASKTMSEWTTLRALEHPNIVRFNDGHWLPLNVDQDEPDPKGQCELYIKKPLLSVTVAAATAQYSWSLIDVRRICEDTLHALNYLAGQKLLRGDFSAKHILVTGEGFKLPNVHLCQVAQDNDDVEDLRSVGRIFKDILESSGHILDGKLRDFYNFMLEERTFKNYLVVLPTLLDEYWPLSGGEDDKISQNEKLDGIVYLVSQMRLNTFEL